MSSLEQCLQGVVIYMCAVLNLCTISVETSFEAVHRRSDVIIPAFKCSST